MSSDHPAPIATGLRGRCPRCGQGHLFKGFLSLRPRCEACGLDYGFADAGDGPAFFVMTVVGLVVCALAAWVEVVWEPPFWIHVLLWFPLITVLSLGLVRPLKGAMIALQYAHKAEEGRLR